MSFYALPKTSNAEFLEVMSPKNLIYFKKNHEPIFMPTHEIMQGLIFASKVIIPENLETFDSLEDANQFRRKNRNFKWQTLFWYQGNQTTLARERLSELFGKDINSYLENFNNTLNSKNLIPLYSGLADFEDRTDRIQKIQEFALNIATLSGATAPKLSQLYADVSSEILDQIKVIEADKYLSDTEKYVKVQDLYTAYAKEQEDKFDESVKLTIKESSRSKVSQLLNIVLPQMNVGPDKDTTVSQTRLIEGMNPRDYTSLAVENRAVQDIKVSAVPLGGFLTRQFAFLSMSYYYSAGKDETNPGIFMPMKEAIGRTLTNGDIVKPNKSDELVKVRSIITSTLKNPDVISSDMIPNIFNYKDESRIGLSMMTSLTEGLTQAGLSLKHGGALFGIEPNGNIKSNFEGKVIVNATQYWIMITEVDTNKVHAYPKPNNFVQSFSPSGQYSKGELIGSTLKMNTPAYRLDSIITLCGARKVLPNKRFARNKVLISDCYAVNSGVIHYKQDPSGDIRVFIDQVEYTYNQDALYMFAEGEKVNKYDRICSGTLDMVELTKKVKNYVEIFYYFKKQFQELIDGIQSELLEFLYVLIVRNSTDGIKLTSVMNSIYHSKSFYTAIAFGNAKKKFRELPVEGRDFIGDTMTRVMLSLITNNKIL